MKNLNVKIPDELDDKLRKAIGCRKGNLGKVVTEALTMWLAARETQTA